MAAGVQRRLIHKGAKFDFEQVTIPARSGGVVTREVVRHPGAVVIVPILADDAGTRLVLIRNTRAALDRVLWECPAGTLEPPEPPEACAARELEEETGFAAASIEPIASYYTTPGMTDELMHAFVATDLAPVPQRLEEDERIVVEPVSIGEAFGLIDRGELVDAKSILAILLAQRRGLLHT